MATGDLKAGVTLQWTSILSRGEVQILLVALCNRDWDKLKPDGHLVHMQTYPLPFLQAS